MLNKAASRNKNAVGLSGTLLIFTFFQILIVLEKLYFAVFFDFQKSLWVKCFLFFGMVFSKYFEMYLNTLLKYSYFVFTSIAEKYFVFKYIWGVFCRIISCSCDLA